MYHIQSQISEMGNPEPEKKINENRARANRNQNQQLSLQTYTMSNFTSPTTFNTDQNMSKCYSNIQPFNVKMNTRLHDSSTDIDKYLTQFLLIAKITKWSYLVKSLYLASGLTGNARSRLSELTETQKGITPVFKKF